MPHILDELQWRGLIVQSTDADALRASLGQGGLTYYCGFDPTAASLHVGHLVQLLTMRRLQLAGNHPLALVGGATGLIGDPRMSGERQLHGRDVVAGWVERLEGQISGYLDFTGSFAARMVNNLDWTSQLSAIDLLRDVGKHFRLGTMLAKDTVARRLASDQGISYTEFSYQVLQGMDFLELHRRYGCTLQSGGNDQWGNLLSGVELIRRVEQTAVHAMTTPLITKSDGTKFGKSEGGAVWLDPAMTTPYAFHQFWLNADDADVLGYLRVFTFLDADAIDELGRSTAERPAARAAQRALAHEVTALVHGATATAAAEAAGRALFGAGELADLDPGTLEAAVEGLPTAPGAVGDLVVDLFAGTGLVPSRSAARRAVADGGAYVNNVKVDAEDRAVRAEDLLHGRWILLRRGKRTLGVIDTAPDGVR